MDVSNLDLTISSDQRAQIGATCGRRWVRPSLSRLEAGSAENNAVQGSDGPSLS